MIELPDVERMIDAFAAYATGKTVSEVLIDDPEATTHLPHPLGRRPDRHHAARR